MVYKVKTLSVSVFAVILLQACLANGESKVEANVETKKSTAISNDVAKPDLASKKNPNDAMQSLDFKQLSVPELKKLEAKWYKTIQTGLDPRCDSTAQCQFIAVGVNPCGGPLKYMIYSRLKTNEQALQTHVKKYNSLNRYLNKKLGRMGACVFIQPPALICEKQICRENTPMLRNL